MKDFDLRDLDAFVAVARTRNFRRAAVEQGVSVSSLSQRLRDMEERLGVRLMNRTTRSVALTEAGELLLARVGPAMSDVGAALDQVRGLRAVPSGRLRINAPPPARFLRPIPRSTWRSSARARSSISWPEALTPACAMASIWRRT
jgi:DNA-binding transcriptional LysR family regulator